MFFFGKRNNFILLWRKEWRKKSSRICFHFLHDLHWIFDVWKFIKLNRIYVLAHFFNIDLYRSLEDIRTGNVEKIFSIDIITICMYASADGALQGSIQSSLCSHNENKFIALVLYKAKKFFHKSTMNRMKSSKFFWKFVGACVGGSLAIFDGTAVGRIDKEGPGVLDLTGWWEIEGLILCDGLGLRDGLALGCLLEKTVGFGVGLGVGDGVRTLVA